MHFGIHAARDAETIHNRPCIVGVFFFSILGKLIGYVGCVRTGSVFSSALTWIPSSHPSK
jgi:hypothetical protein